MKEDMQVPGWLVLMASLSLAPLALFGFFKVLDMSTTASNKELYYLAGFAFLVPVFAALVYAMGVLIDEEKIYRHKGSSGFRYEEHKKSLKGRLGK